jgi:DNA helicase-2/ATP-dependent DNA helicase PcrA
VNFMQRALESALRLARVPYQIVAGQEFYERREIRDLVAYAKLCVNPADDIAFRRVVNVPARGIGDKSLEAIAQLALDRRIPMSEAVRSSEALLHVRGRARAGLEELSGLLARLVPLRDQPADVALEQILEEIGIERWLREMDDGTDNDRQANVDELLTHAAAYESMVGESRRDPTPGVEPLEGGLRGFLQDIALVNDTDALETDTDKVSLMTLHSAKGLEFPIVFIAGLEEELLPHSRAIADTSGDRPDSGIEEERRLFYVGITRARERLFLAHAQQRMFFGDFAFRMPSRFLGEIPPALVEGFEPDKEADEMLGAYDDAHVEAFAVGDRVEHEHFGRGTIERLQGAGINARATVHFPAHGTKMLLLQYAHLKRIPK